jgi:MerR family transcriptional regulator, heat shock protein HspR
VRWGIGDAILIPDYGPLETTSASLQGSFLFREAVFPILGKKTWITGRKPVSLTNIVRARNLYPQIQISETALHLKPLTLPNTDHQTLYTVGEAADLVGVSIPTLRMYEREGLIVTNRRQSRHRRYTQTDIDRLLCIRRMIRKEKISIAGIRRLLALIPCWKIKNCPEEARSACGAFQQHEAPCWMATHRSWDCKSTECRICPVYADVADCNTLKQQIARHTITPHP